MQVRSRNYRLKKKKKKKKKGGGKCQCESGRQNIPPYQLTLFIYRYI